MRVNPHADSNPEGMQQGRWFTLPEYPSDVFTCPLCDLPETDEVYECECDCWDAPAKPEATGGSEGEQ